MKNKLLLLVPILTVCSTGCITYRHRCEIVNEPALKAMTAQDREKFRVVEFRFKSDLQGDDGKERTVDGKHFNDWLVSEHPDVFSSSGDSTPIIVRETMTVPPAIKTKGGIQPNIFDIIVTQLTLGLWPATIAGDYRFGTEILLNEGEYSTPFAWNTRYTDHVANSIVADLYYPSSNGWETGNLENTMNRVRAQNELQRAIVSRKSTEEEKHAARTEMIWQAGYHNPPEIMKRGAGLGIVGALVQLTPEQRQAVRDNPVARYLADKADGKLAGQESSEGAK